MVTINTGTKRQLASWNVVSSTLSGKTETKASNPDLSDHSRLTPSHSVSIHKSIKSQRMSWLKCVAVCLKENSAALLQVYIIIVSPSLPWGNLHQSACVDLCWALHQNAYAGRPSLYHVRVTVLNHWGASIRVPMQMVAGRHCSLRVANSQRPHKFWVISQTRSVL